ncbi:MAG: hypothetical protein AB7L65_04445 [Hyphomonadaceae bacterium]
MKFDPRITYALILAVLIEAAGGFIWAGKASARLENVERATQAGPEIAERLARLEAQMEDARHTLSRIERKLER